MFSTDYYQVLQIQPTASSEEVRKAYRRLALEFHPDKNKTQQASTQFVMIREAYAVLSDPVQRRKYDLSRFAGQPTSRRIATTPEEVRLMSDELVERIKRNNPDRINRDKLVLDLEAVLSVYHIQLLEKYKDAHQNELLVNNILFCLQFLEWNNCMQFADTIKAIHGLNPISVECIHHFIHVYKRNYYWNRYKILFALLVAIITCFLIYYA
ncbi:MAG TPA: hypothetical protein DHW64_08410 [Chitinophagaceae bacterium]|jgi:molecular chaperone DnaJ|nr:hypothetical protein [Chitinophagaceae bacterium]